MERFAQGTDEEKSGELSVALVGTDRSGQQYRLRNATFEIYGYGEYSDTGAAAQAGSPNLGEGGGFNGYGDYYHVVSSDDEPNASVITEKLVPGSYYVTLYSGTWYLERLTSSGPERVQQAVLLSEPTQYAYVRDGGTSSLYYTFGVDGQLIDFRSGELNININIEHPGEQPSGGGYGGEGGAEGDVFDSGGAPSR
jgi:hypothetical protein